MRSSLSTIQILIDSHQLSLISSLSSDTDSDRFTPAVFDIESVNDTDSDRFTPAVFDIESVNDTDSDRFTPAVFEIESVKLTDSDRFTPAEIESLIQIESVKLQILLDSHQLSLNRVCQRYRF